MTNDNDNIITRNLITTGLGFMNRIRTVKPNSGKPYVAVTMALEEGRVSNMTELNKTYYECRVVGSDALELLAEYFTDENGEVNAPEDSKVRAAVRLGGCEVRTFTYSKGDKAGSTGVSLRSRLIAITYLTIDGDVMYKNVDDNGNDGSPTPTDDAQPDESISATDEPSAVESDTAEHPVAQSDKAELSPAEQNALLDQCQVSLEKTDVLFEQKRAFLKANGYRWNKVNVAWVKKDQPPVDTAPLKQVREGVTAAV